MKKILSGFIVTLALVLTSVTSASASVPSVLVNSGPIHDASVFAQAAVTAYYAGYDRVASAKLLTAESDCTDVWAYRSRATYAFQYCTNVTNAQDAFAAILAIPITTNPWTRAVLVSSYDAHIEFYFRSMAQEATILNA